MLLDIENLSVAAGEKMILNGVNLQMEKGQVLILFGPNGSGKSTLIKSIMGFSGYSIKKGRINFADKSIDKLSIEERERLGIGIMYQRPPVIRGVKLRQVARFLCDDESKIKDLSQKLSLEEHLDRDINLDYSGGEMKRSELFQVLLQDPQLLLLDEPESGVDLENISIMGGVLNGYLAREDKSAIIITHTGYILDYINAEKGCVMIDGSFWCAGIPKEIFENIKSTGYAKCKECKWPKKKE